MRRRETPEPRRRYRAETEMNARPMRRIFPLAGISPEQLKPSVPLRNTAVGVDMVPAPVGGNATCAIARSRAGAATPDVR